MEELARLQSWYAANCDGNWEHTNGIVIDTLDNPGWRFEVDLADTPLNQRLFNPVSRQAQDLDSDWVRCDVVNGKFRGFGGPTNLTELVNVFLVWAEHVV